MENDAKKVTRRNKVVKTIINLLPLVIITEIGIILYYTMLWKNLEKGLIIEDFYMRSSKRSIRRAIETQIEGGF